MPAPLEIKTPLFLFLIDDEMTYLQRRHQNDSFAGYYEPPGGGLEENESLQEGACRETFQEAGVIVDPDDIELFHMYQNDSEAIKRLGFMFRTRRFKGVPTIKEPDYCDDSGWYRLDALPKLTPQVQFGIRHLIVGPSIEAPHYKNLVYGNSQKVANPKRLTVA